MKTDDETEAEAQMEADAEAIREAVLRLLQDGEVDPQFVVMAAARVTGELGADIARLGGVDLQTILGDLADLVRLTEGQPRRPVAGCHACPDRVGVRGAAPAWKGAGRRPAFRTGRGR